MNFAHFQTYRQELLADRPHMKDCAETNLYRALAHLMSPPPPPVEGTVHRCHLASQWTEFQGLPRGTSRQALISCGVRDSLGLLFSHYAQQQVCLWLPEDNYPVYHELAHAAGLTPLPFPTLPEPIWPQTEPAEAAEILLVTHPLKPRGRALNEDDARQLKHWLAASPHRRVWLDTVYQLQPGLDDVTRDLLATGQVLLLHSLTKGWLHPRLFGIALVPETDLESLTPVFRAAPPPQPHLAQARYLMRDHAEMPKAVLHALADARAKLTQALPEVMTQALPSEPPAYLFPVQLSFDELLERDVLGLPASVFGSPRTDLSFVSSLPFITP